MSRVTFENYGRRAEAAFGETELSGRYQMQEEAERRIVPDVIDKLALDADHRLLEIGCGAGNILIPLSFVVASSTGVDHEAVLSRMKERGGTRRITRVPGNFLDLKIETKFDRILIYSVLHCLTDFSEVRHFVEKACELLAPGGRMLIGDIPNVDRKGRFANSAVGKAFERTWQEESRKEAGSGSIAANLINDPDLATFDDEAIHNLLVHIRKFGFESYLLPQSSDLPFGHTREDILVINDR
tara:strand:+ start:14 stop:739 length:726 start_codon:yes stop_codon:yes gene_type:complete